MGGRSRDSFRPRGVFIALEGIDGAGTTTQASFLQAWLISRGLRPLITREPSPGEVGKVIRKVLSGGIFMEPGGLALLFAADRLDHLAREILPALEGDRPVICDRYLLSSLAYQSQRREERPWIRAINSRARWPDITIFLDVDVSTALERIAIRRKTPELFEEAATLEQVARAYQELAGEEGVVQVDGSMEPDEVFQAILGHVGPLFKGVVPE